MNIKIWMLIHNHTNITRNLHTTEIKSAVYLMQLAVHLINAKKPSTETVTL